MNGVERSNVPVRHGFPNPKYGQMLALIRSVPEFRELAARVREHARTLGPDVKLCDLRKNCSEAGIRSQLYDLIGANRNIKDKKPVLGSPPPTNVVYGMFGKGTNVVDVGSGNCMKIRRYTGDIKFSAVDPQLCNESKHVLREFKMTLGDFCVQNPRDYIFSSWMVMTQLTSGERGILEDNDGVHLVPDHDVLISQGVATRCGEKVKVRTIRGTYEDDFLPLRGVAISPGYLLVAFFKQRNLALTTFPRELKGKYVPGIDAQPAGFYDLNFLDVSPKFDGVPYEIECHDRKVFVTGRNGHYRQGTCDFDFHMCLHAERLDGVWVLFRIVQYRGMVPPHHGSILRLFCERINVTIDGEKLIPPPSWKGGNVCSSVLLQWEWGGAQYNLNAPTDGIISRSDGSDYYCKYMWTVDLRKEDFPIVEDLLKSKGFSPVFGGEWEPGINELALTRDGAKVKFKFLKKREDKTRVTSAETVLFLVDRPTLGEASVLTDSHILV